MTGLERIRIATRPSLMALSQANRVRTDLLADHPGVEVTIVEVVTDGDRWTGPLSELGGKGAFVKGVEQLLLDGRADLAVHCLKDMPGDVAPTEGLTVVGYPRRDDPLDALVTRDGASLNTLPLGSRIGTSAPRRAAQLAARYPHLEIVPVRGNADTRLRLVEEGIVDGVVVAHCGLTRIGRGWDGPGGHSGNVRILGIDTMMPALGAGLLAFQCRTDDHQTAAAVEPLTHDRAALEALAERTLLTALHGNCHAAIAGNALALDEGGDTPTGEVMLTGEVYSPDGRTRLTSTLTGLPKAAGRGVAADLIALGARDLLDT